MQIIEYKKNNSIVKEIEKHVRLKSYGDIFKGLCPFHKEKTPSFTVYPSTQSYFCFGCSAHGDVIDFKRKIECKTLPEVLGKSSPIGERKTLKLFKSIERSSAVPEAIKIVPNEGIQEFWNIFDEDGISEYLELKQVPNLGGRFFKGNVYYPLRDLQETLWGIQEILADGSKRFLANSKTAGKFHVLGCAVKDASKIIVVEGYATGASVHMATTECVVVAFNSINLRPVVKLLKHAYPTCEIVVAADNDCWGEDGFNVGLDAANVCKVPVVYPVFSDRHHDGQPTDFNDLHVLEGLEAVKAQLEIKAVEDIRINDGLIGPVINSDAPPPPPPSDTRKVIESPFLHQIDEIKRLVNPDLISRYGYYFSTELKRAIRILNGEIVEVSYERFIKEFSECLKVVKTNSKGDQREIYAPREFMQVMFKSLDSNDFPVLMGLAYQPYFSKCGQLIIRSGYSSLTSIFGIWDDFKYISLLGNKTKEDAYDAYMTIGKLFSGFSFKNDSDRVRMIAAAMTGVLRQSFDSAPLMHFTAPTYGSGKSYGCEIIANLVTNQHVGFSNFKKDSDEFEKILVSRLRQKIPVIVFDNLEKELYSHSSLCTVLTASIYNGRILGRSEVCNFSTQVTFLSSGNNIYPKGDMKRRTLVIEMDPETERPEERDFNFDALGSIKLNREKYISAFLTIILAYKQDGSEKFPLLNMNGFESWADHCIQPLLWLGENDPLAQAKASQEIDPEEEYLGTLLDVLVTKFHEDPFTINNLCKISNYQKHNTDDRQLFEALKDCNVLEKDGDCNSRRVAWFFRKNLNKICLSLKLIKSNKIVDKVSLWQIKRIEAPPAIVILGAIDEDAEAPDFL